MHNELRQRFVKGTRLLPCAVALQQEFNRKSNGVWHATSACAGNPGGGTSDAKHINMVRMKHATKIGLFTGPLSQRFLVSHALVLCLMLFRTKVHVSYSMPPLARNI